MKNFKIESGIPIPERNPYKGTSKWLKLYNSMKVGDSVLVTEKERAAWIERKKKDGMHIVTRRESENVCRVWKVEPEADE